MANPTPGERSVGGCPVSTRRARRHGEHGERRERSGGAPGGFRRGELCSPAGDRRSPLQTPPGDAKPDARRSKEMNRHSGLDPESRNVNPRREAPQITTPPPSRGRGGGEGAQPQKFRMTNWIPGQARNDEGVSSITPLPSLRRACCKKQRANDYSPLHAIAGRASCPRPATMKCPVGTSQQ
jgi:hypothetical protein